MGLEDLAPEHWRPGVLNESVADAAEAVIPDFFLQGDKAPTYRAHPLKEYKENDGIPPRRDDNGQYRTRQEIRLDRAWVAVADRMDRDENTIRNCVLGVYEDEGEYDDRPARLRNEFDEIVERATEE